MEALCITALSISVISLIAMFNCYIGHIKCERRVSALERKIDNHNQGET